MIFKHAALAVGLLTAGVSAQGVNCALLSTFNNYGPFNDIWGYAAPNGDEYALLCTTTGTVVVDVTNPSNPIERGWFPFGSSSWRDCRTYGTYAYVVTEATSGFQIIDLSNPNNPTAVGTFGTSVTNNAHNPPGEEDEGGSITDDDVGYTYFDSERAADVGASTPGGASLRGDPPYWTGDDTLR